MPQLFIREMILKRVGENGDSSGFPDQADCLSRSDLFPRDKVGTGISYITCESLLHGLDVMMIQKVAGKMGPGPYCLAEGFLHLFPGNIDSALVVELFNHFPVA